jgi:hypothetical protein
MHVACALYTHSGLDTAAVFHTSQQVTKTLHFPRFLDIYNNGRRCVSGASWYSGAPSRGVNPTSHQLAAWSPPFPQPVSVGGLRFPRSRLPFGRSLKDKAWVSVRRPTNQKT